VLSGKDGNLASKTALSQQQPAQASVSRYRLGAEFLAGLYVGIIASIAWLTGAAYAMFPEMGALSYDVLGRPRGRWARAPIYLALTPALMGLVGVLITRQLPFGTASVMLTVLATLTTFILIKSPIAPSISAGLLPLVLDVKSWWYPFSVFFGCTLLSAISEVWKRFCPYDLPGGTEVSRGEKREATDDQPPNRRGLAALLIFVAAIAYLAKIFAMRLLLFPPLVVIAYEMFGHPLHCPWAERPLRLPLTCFLTASCGYAFYTLFGASPITAILSVAMAMVILRTANLYVPPALAVSLLPMVINSPTIRYPLCVGASTLLLSVWFVSYQRVAKRLRRLFPIADETFKTGAAGETRAD